MIVLKELFNNIKRTNLRILLLWIILTQVIMFGLYIQLLRFTANREFRTVTKGPRLPVNKILVISPRFFLNDNL